MRLTFVTGQYPPTPCGVGDHTARLARALGVRGHQVTVLTSVLPSDVSGDGASGPEQVVRIAQRWDAQDVQQVVTEAQRRRSDMVHLQYHAVAFGGRAAIVGLPWRLRQGCRTKVPKIVVTLHELAGPPVHGLPPWVRRAWLLPLINGADAVIVTNERDEAHLRLIPWLASRLHRIPLASNVDVHPTSALERQAIRHRLSVVDHEMLLVRFGFVNNVRGSLLRELLEAVQQVRTQGYRVRLAFVGDAEKAAREELVAMARRLGIDRVVHYTGHCSTQELSSYLQSADLAVQPYPEGVCERRSALQAVMAHGLPVISTKRGHPPSMYRHGEHLWLVPVGDSRRMAEGIVTLLRAPDLRARLGQGAAAVAAQFTWERVSRTTEALYQSLLPCGAGGAVR